MTLNLEIPRALEDKLAAEAGRLGLPMKEYALRVLSTSSAASPRGDTEIRQPVDRRRAVERIRALRRGITTGGMSIRSMIEEGRSF